MGLLPGTCLSLFLFSSSKVTFSFFFLSKKLITNHVHNFVKKYDTLLNLNCTNLELSKKLVWTDDHGFKPHLYLHIDALVYLSIHMGI